MVVKIHVGDFGIVQPVDREVRLAAVLYRFLQVGLQCEHVIVIVDRFR